jgi:beta-lactamase regulating signal transducer with metallopeptidase domain
MSWLPVETVAQISVERILNALPEGFLIAVFAWALLRVLRKQNSGTRFAVWFLALLTVALVPLLGGFGEGRALAVGATSSSCSWASMGPAITIPARWGLVVFLAWAFGACAALLRLAAGLWRLRQLRRSCHPVAAAGLDPAVRKTVDAITRSKSLSIATSDSIRVPAAIGFWKRIIVLPAWALTELPPDDLNVILLHEFAHLRRGDDWTNLIQKIVRALLFFHPAVWWIESRLSVEREMACDDAVLAETANPHGYASCLVSLLEKSLAHRGWSMAQAAVHRAREASLRLAQILDKNRPAATGVSKPALGMVGVFAVVCLALLPNAPRFVAFDRGMSASDSGHLYSAAGSRGSAPAALAPFKPAAPKTAAVIPAAFTPDDASPLKMNVKLVRAHAVRRPQPAFVRELAARLKASPRRERVVEVNANAEPQIVPRFQTLVLIERTEFVTSDSSVWCVEVWRVTLLGPARRRLAEVPVADSI